MILKTDCKHFPGDRPCVFNKTEGVMCDDCPHYRVNSFSILIIKLDAVGDVLRTTCILHGLKARYPDSEITWVTRQSSIPLFENNRLVDRVLVYESTEAILSTAVQQFDLLINLDAARDSAALASRVQSAQKRGFGLDSKGHVSPFNTEAVRWLEMGAFDQKKKANVLSYQDLMLEICGLGGSPKDIVLPLSDAEKAFAEDFARRHSLGTGKIRIGINTGASPRWQYKKWTEEGFVALLKLILQKTDWTVLLYGGPHEVERNAHLASIDRKKIIDTGTGNTLRQFFALVSLCDVFFTGDTMGVHVATALKKKIVAYVGPTSAAEIDAYGGQVTKIQSDLDCLVCYKPRCDFNPNCMNSLSAERMFSAIESASNSLRRP